jgi:phosphonate transport system permease protein
MNVAKTELSFIARLQAFIADMSLIAASALMVQFLVWFLFLDARDGVLESAQDVLGKLSFVHLTLLSAILAVSWHFFCRQIGSSPGLAFAGYKVDGDEDLAWSQTLSGWFLVFFVELTFFTGWVVTEVDLYNLLTNFQKAAGVLRGLAHPSSSVLFEGLVLLVQTLFLAFMATAFAIPPAFFLAFLAARNLTRKTWYSRLTYTFVRTVMNFTRAVEPLVWALIFISWVGIGPYAGVLALWVHSVAGLVKLYSEQVENIDYGPVEAVTATGAGLLQVLRYGVVPQVIPPFLSFTIYRWDINVRMSTIIGFVGGGGIGYILKPRVDLGEWGEVSTLVLLIAVAVWAMDLVSAKIRERIV